MVSEHREDVGGAALLAGQRTEHLPVTVLHAGNTEEDVDDDRATLDVCLGARHADTGCEVVEVEQDLDQSGAAEVVERDHATAEGGDEPVLRLVGEADAHRRRDPRTVGGELGGPGRGLRRRHLLDASVDRGIDGGVEVRHRREQSTVVGAARRLGAVEIGERRAGGPNEVCGERANGHTIERARFIPAGGDLATSDQSGGGLDRFDDQASHSATTRRGLDPAHPMPSAERTSHQLGNPAIPGT